MTKAFSVLDRTCAVKDCTFGREGKIMLCTCHGKQHIVHANTHDQYFDWDYVSSNLNALSH